MAYYWKCTTKEITKYSLSNSLTFPPPGFWETDWLLESTEWRLISYTGWLSGGLSLSCILEEENQRLGQWRMAAVSPDKLWRGWGGREGTQTSGKKYKSPKTNVEPRLFMSLSILRNFFNLGVFYHQPFYWGQRDDLPHSWGSCLLLSPPIRNESLTILELWTPSLLPLLRNLLLHLSSLSLWHQFLFPGPLAHKHF